MSDNITITGNIVTPPELKRTSGGVTITSFRVASKHRRFDRATGRWTDGDTSFYSASIFRSLAEHAFDSLHKGDRVILTGRLRLREWESGGRQGISADIEVDGIGHDLLYGTTQFERDGRTRPSDPVPGSDVSAAAGDVDRPEGAWATPDDTATPQWPTREPGTVDEWAVPAVDEASADEAAAAAAVDRGAREPEPVGVDTPF